MIHISSRAAHPRPSLTDPFGVHISPAWHPSETCRCRQLEYRAATPNAARTGAAASRRAVEIARRVGEQAGDGDGRCPVAAGEDVEHGQAPRRVQLEHRAATIWSIAARRGAALLGCAVE